MQSETRSDKARRLAAQAADAAVGAIAGADAVIRRAGLTTRDGRISKAKLGWALLRPRSSAGRLIRAAAVEIDSRKARRPADRGRPVAGTGPAPAGIEAAPAPEGPPSGD